MIDAKSEAALLDICGFYGTLEVVRWIAEYSKSDGAFARRLNEAARLAEDGQLGVIRAFLPTAKP